MPAKRARARKAAEPEAPRKPINQAELIKKVMAHVGAQIDLDRKSLEALPHAKWYDRVRKTARSFLPDLVRLAPDLMRVVEEALNSPEEVRDTWRDIRNHLEKGDCMTVPLREMIDKLDGELKKEEALTKVTGTSVSGVIAQFWREARPDIRENSAVNYPDLYFHFSDYSGLPARTKANVKEPAVRGGKPSNVPDGVEIKSQKGKRVNVDAHQKPKGIHLALTFSNEKGRWKVHDVLTAYLSEAAYTPRAVNTPSSTVKFSFGHAPFISVITGEAKPVTTEVVEGQPGSAEAEE